MPRPPRLHVPGGCYHVMLRGNHREALFGAPRDRDYLASLFADVIQRLGARIHAYCWMTNHLHVLLQIADQPLGKVMQRVAARYSRHRHRALRMTGHLFERRYRAKLIDVDEYFLTVLRYIHLNPVKARMVTDAADYPWSSHRTFLGLESTQWLTTDFGLSLFGSTLTQARIAYSDFIRSADPLSLTDPDDDAHPEDTRIIGSDHFIQHIPFTPYKPRSLVTLQQLAKQICVANGANVEALRSPSRARQLAPIRVQFIKQAIEQRIATLSEVARYLNRDPSALGRLVKRHSAMNKA